MVQQERVNRHKSNKTRSLTQTSINTLSTAIEQRFANPKVKAYALLTLQDDGTMVTQTSNPGLEHWTTRTFDPDTQRQFREAHNMSTNGSSPRLGSQATASGVRISPHPFQHFDQFTVVDHPYMDLDITKGDLYASSLGKRKFELGDADSVSDGSSGFSTVQTKSIRIDNSAEVNAFMRDRLRCLQQLVVKAIAKAWIKGICPKKQAKFPYRNHKRDKPDADALPPTVPGWWPQDPRVCRFIEPDHIGRTERLNLCVHLLRLRPDPDQLAEWNKDSFETRNTHRTHGWTEFLEELATPAMVCGVGGPGKEERRRELLTQLYTVARMEQEYESGGIDGDATFTWRLEPTKVMATKKTKLSTSSDTESEVESFDGIRASSPYKSRVAEAGSPESSSNALLPHRVPKVEKTHGQTSRAGLHADPSLNSDARFTGDAVPIQVRSGHRKRPLATCKQHAVPRLRTEHRSHHSEQPHALSSAQWQPRHGVTLPDQGSPLTSFPTAIHSADHHSITFDKLPNERYASQPGYTSASIDSKQFVPLGHQAYSMDMTTRIPQTQFVDTMPDTPLFSEPGFLGSFDHRTSQISPHYAVETHGLPTPMPGAIMSGPPQGNEFQFQPPPQQYIGYDQTSLTCHTGPGQDPRQDNIRPNNAHQLSDMGQQPSGPFPMMDQRHYPPGGPSYCADYVGTWA